ncbi:tumor necrosis factor receptor superfamily member 14-like [Brienomyrus brachyistius]|uniref:tumor necrosis factor receptor superfamily member 14-like n=1 Tax=Brienomyrus brachyistius TaxID=42636 RepID=UPI0020B18C97|nr:tumor necrosis factor receptor superfamily member 14-like [Brienomyrus brachyistius]
MATCKFQVYLPYLLLLCLTLCHACNLTEYEVGEECCRMCPSGHHVQKHCSGNANTTCAPCTTLTFNDEPNGLAVCKQCAVCDQGLGLETVTACTPTSDTVCRILEGHFCINPYKGGCRTAHEHTACNPGQFVKQSGTASADTICEDCQENTYSNGSSTSCMPHATCKPGQFIYLMGTASADTTCEDCQENTYSNGSSTSCMPHATCKPGQFIYLMGTKYADTECEDCQENTYSNGSSTSCISHTDCESEGRVTARAGDPSSDAECGETTLPHHVLWPSLAAVVFVLGTIAIVICRRRKKRVQSYEVAMTKE